MQRSLTGDDDDDILDGGAGNDTLVGGNNNDTYMFSTGQDVVLGFDRWTDVLDFSNFDTIKTVDDLKLTQFDEGLLVADTTGNTLWIDALTSTDYVEFRFEEIEVEADIDIA